MVKRTLVPMILVFVLMCTTVGCRSINHKTGIYTNSDYILVDNANKVLLEFQLAMFSSDKIKSIEVIDFEGNNVDDLKCLVEDNTASELNKYKYRNFYTYTMDLSVLKGNADEIEINKIVMKINGKKKIIPFKNAIKHSFKEGHVWGKKLEISSIPNELSSNCLSNNNRVFPYEFNTTDNIKLEKPVFKNFVKADNFQVLIDNEIVNKEDVFPLEVGKGKNIKIDFNINPLEEDIDNKYYILTNLTFNFSSDNGVNSEYDDFIVNINPIYPIEDLDMTKINEYIDTIIYNE